MSTLDSLSKSTVIVIDTGDIDAIKEFSPRDATTNPSLIMKAASKAEYKHLIDEAVEFGKKNAKGKDDVLHQILDKLFVNFGLEILKIIPGRVSTEVEARLSFDKEASLKKARHLIQLYEQAGIPRERVLIKLASTWEGAAAAKELEKEGIHCNMTLMFSLAQAIASSDAKATLVSPFVGRIYDWYKTNRPLDKIESPELDPGVISVANIYNYYKKHDIKTEVMGASFRYKEQITALSGCDLLTISPQLLKELKEAKDDAPKKLTVEAAKKLGSEKIEMEEKLFRWMMNEDPMATDKLAEGIRLFYQDTKKLVDFIKKTYQI
ncbi:transaldolase [Estrella lausannensis]|uniref:Transaldolase n=1 Tax=Estrella lausannensis TaxID=483423 RepID=A0A0H5DQW8_9BACT|nr:transaldolase [Estrella lausannensis]CRX38004.1 Transaldolase [Estrella lausannensis]